MKPEKENRPDAEEADVVAGSIDFPVVGIGASAGGLTALQRLFGSMPSDTGMAFVIVVHLSPNHESTLDEILQRSTRMPVRAVKEDTRIEPDHVYVVSPAKRLTMSDGALCATELNDADGRQAAIDHFFRSLAQAHRERAVCVVLSGTGSDGTQGLKRIKELGGVTLAQSPDDAEYLGMPQSAVDSGVVDLVLPVAEMPAKLMALWDNVKRLELPKPPDNLKVEYAEGDAERLAEEALLSIKALLRERTGHNFAHYKRATVLRRLERRMQVVALPDLPTYRRFLESHPLETPALLQDMLISVTNFFRDPEAFAALEQALRESIRNRSRDQPFRAWVAGCATGEEAYSVAMLLNELLAPLGTPLQVFASDIDQRAIAIARTGAYDASIAADVPPARMRQHFKSETRGYRIAKNIRDSVIFSTHNALSDPPFARMDLICCRNLLIYLDRHAQAQLLRTFHFSLNAGALLFLGSSETADGADHLFLGMDKQHRIYRGKPAAPDAVVMQPFANPVRLVAGTPATLLPPQEPRPALQLLHERVMASYAPPTVLVDADDTVLYVSDRAAHLLRLPAGAPSNKLMSLARPEIRTQLRTALGRAALTGLSVEAPHVRLKVNGVEHYLNISVRPVLDDGIKGLFLVVFDETMDSLVADGGTPDPGEQPMFKELESELIKAKEQLRNSENESAVSTEELRASNEELQTINEELRSTTEELETSREELQSVNEELITVNSELQVKIQETSQTNNDLQNLIVSAEIGTVFVDRNLHINRFTPQAATVFNLLASDTGRSLLDITHRLDYPELAGDVAEVLGSLRRVEREVRSQDGRWFLVRVLPYRTSEDRIDGAVLAFVDVTGRLRAEEEVVQAEKRMRLVAESMRDYAIVTLDLGGTITSWSAGAEKVFGHTAREAIGQSCELIYTPDDRRDGVPAEEMRQARERGRAEDDRWHLRKDGERIYCSGITTSLIDGELTGYAKIARDFTSVELRDRHRDADLRQERSVRGRLQEADALKDEFLAIMSHELKNPLSIIQMNAQLVARLPDLQQEPRLQRAVTAISAAVASQGKIIDDLLDLSRVKTGKIVLQPSILVWQHPIEQIARAVQGDVAAKGQTLNLDLGDAVEVFADAVRVEQIVWNLVSNAIKFTPDGGRIDLRLVSDGGMARLDVQDTGIGLDPLQLEDVFDMFKQVGVRTRRSQPGLGIGLALVRQLATLHGGRVEARSAGLGAGSTLSVWLPLAEQHDDTGFERSEPASGALKGLRILLVDDEPDLLFAFGELMRLEGAEMTIVDNAAQGLEFALREAFDVIVSDIAMPEHDGFWFVQQLRADPKTSSLSIIAVSGMARHADRDAAIAAGFDAHFGKPLAMPLLRAEIQRLITRAA
ncbi:chemotaxis protein CheB [soil metagenome]